MYRRLQNEHGPFDFIGDVHGCADELQCLLEKLGYRILQIKPGLSLSSGPVYIHPENRKAVFLGDLVDRGPHILDTLRIVSNMVRHGSALSVVGNHDDKFLRKLKNHNVQITHGLEATLAELDALPETERRPFAADIEQFLEALPNHYLLDNDRVVVAHAGLKEDLHGTVSGKTRSFALYGETTGQKDEYGLPVRGNWPARYRGNPLVVYGHTPVPEPQWLNNTINLDTGCVFGGRLTALRYPERDIVSVVANDTYYHSPKPFPRALPEPAASAV